MATVKDEAGPAVKAKLAPPTTPMNFHAALPPEPESTGRPFGASKWPEVFKRLIDLYETGQAPGLEDGYWAWCNVQQYSKRGRAQTALKQLTSDGHPWSFELKVSSASFEYAARNNDEGSAIYVRLRGPMPQPANGNTGTVNEQPATVAGNETEDGD